MSRRRSAIPFPQSLWDLLRPGRAAQPHRRPTRKPHPKPASTTRSKPAGAMQLKYEAVTRDMLKRHGVRVRKWRTSMSGVAWQVTYRDGTVSRLIESPKPKGPMSAAIFLHEIGHHAIGFGVYRPRCLEEYHAWKFAVETMEAEGLNVTDRVHARMRDSLRYAVDKAKRRGLKKIPAELTPFLSGKEP